MRQLLKTTAIIGGLTLSLGSTAALAGNCGFGASGPNCQPSVVTHPGGAPTIDPMHVYSTRPMGHLRSVKYLGTPSVNITRIHGQRSSVGLSDAPSAFTSGCNPESTQYCRQGGAQAPMPAPMMPQAMPYMGPPMAPMIAQPAPMIAQPAPYIVQPAPMATERVVHVGGGYDPSKFIPRTYGSNELTPGIAHVPTSIVDRSYDNAMAVLNGGMAQPQAYASGGMVPQMPQSYSNSNYMSSASQSVPMAPQGNVYPGSVSSDGSYYEQVSGPTTMGGLQATQVICKRAAPQVQVPTTRINVQRPIMAVPVPVPTPMAPTCFNAGTGAPVVSSGRYGSYNR